MDNTYFILVVVTAVLTGAIVVSAMLIYRKFEIQRFLIKHQLEKIKGLEKLMPKRLPHNTGAGIEDATAVVIDIVMNAEADYIRAQQALEILQRVRGVKYDPDRPAGPRKP